MFRLVCPVAVVAAVLASSASAGPIQFVGGKSYGEAVSPGDYFQSYDNPSLGASGGFSVSGIGDGGTRSSAVFSHTATSDLLRITGTTSASRTATAATTTAWGLSAGDQPGGTRNYGYMLNFNATTSFLAKLDVTYSQSQGSDSPGTNWTYTDFRGYLLDDTTGQFWELGGFDENNRGAVDGGVFSDPDGLTFPLLLNLIGGRSYTLFLQSQSFVEGEGGSAFANANIGISLAPADVPEPLSVAVFGGLLVAGGLAVRRRLKAKA